MHPPGTCIVQTFILEEIRRVVANTIQDAGSCLRAGQCASVIARAYPNCGMTPDQIAEEIVQAAIRARVNVEMSRPKHETFRLPPRAIAVPG
jgi:hypothetical protein